MTTGLVIPGKEKIFKFSDIEQYLLFFQDTLVRNSGSKSMSTRSLATIATMSEIKLIRIKFLS
ncbi:hypothetical protein Xekk_04391 [Xenorhabdus sp. KK7.4]|nr:hypothetical protein Xekk_04391 [Xenorhabdus sp. KK7.4]